MNHQTKIWERVVDARLKNDVMIKQQYVFMLRKSTIDAMFALRNLMDNSRGQKELHCVCGSRESL